MSNPKQNSNSKTNPANTEEIAEVLYQRLGNRWYAFSVIEDELFVGSISDEEVNAQASGAPGVFKVTGNT